MNVLFIAGFAPITADPASSVQFYKGAIGLPLEAVSGDYQASDSIGGCKHFGVWPLADAAQSCFGTSTWPDHIPTPNAGIEFEVDDVESAATELVEGGHTLVHDAKVEPWGQTIARLMSPEGLLVGVCHTPWFHDSAD